MIPASWPGHLAKGVPRTQRSQLPKLADVAVGPRRLCSCPCDAALLPPGVTPSTLAMSCPRRSCLFRAASVALLTLLLAPAAPHKQEHKKVSPW